MQGFPEAEMNRERSLTTVRYGSKAAGRDGFFRPITALQLPSQQHSSIWIPEPLSLSHKNFSARWNTGWQSA